MQSFLRGPMVHPPSHRDNQGDGLKMVMKLGAALGNMREAWWVPVMVEPGEGPDAAPVVRLVLRERTLPRSLMVNRKGRRFANEATNYNAFGAAFHEFDSTEFEYRNLPCWLIVDGGYVRRYGGFGRPAGAFPEVAVKAATVSELATRIGVPAEALDETVRRFNRQVAEGRDADFARGESAYDGWSGDQGRYPDVAATLGPLDEPPYYAIEVHSSSLGTKGGPRTDTDGAVLDVDGAPINGLYAAGNAMSAPTGMVYGGAGGTLGPAVTFGYLAGRAAAHNPAL